MKSLFDRGKAALNKAANKATAIAGENTELLYKGKQALSAVTDKVTQELKSGFAMAKEVINGLPVFVSLEQSTKFATLYDEKHYFVIPYRLSPTGFSLHTLRCLPKNIDDVNDLPKRRIFHFANEHAQGALQQHMLDTASVMAKSDDTSHISPLESLANDIDKLDNKLTYGMLFVGGVAAFINPLIGAGIAVKALLPGVGTLVNKYGLRPMGEKHTQSNQDKAVESAQQKVMDEFSQANTIKVINPILQELELALNTDEFEHDPLMDANLANGSLPELDDQRWRELTETAMYNVYKEVYRDPNKQAQAGLGPEDIRWLRVLFSDQAS
jgi:hypothetical protein